MSDLFDDLFGKGFSAPAISEQEAQNHNLNLVHDLICGPPRLSRWKRFIAWLKQPFVERERG